MSQKSNLPVPDHCPFSRLFPALASIALCGFWAPSASAQSDPDVEEPDFFESVDPNGVNLSTRHITVPLAGMSIGDGQGQMIYDLRYQSARNNAGVKDIYRGNRAKMISHSSTGSNCSSYDYLITLSGSTELFEWISDAFRPDDSKSGNSLQYDAINQKMVYHLKDGTIAYFNVAPIGGYCGPGTTDKIVFPDGRTYKFNYVFSGTIPEYFGHNRLVSVSSNLGYQIRFSYGELGPYTTSTSAKLINSAVDYCDESSFSCQYSSTWPEVTRNQGVYSSPDGTVTKFTSATGQLSVERSGLDTTYAQISSNGVVSSLARGNSVTSYNYTRVNQETADCVNRVTRTNPDQTADIFYHRYESSRENGLVCKHTDALARTTVFEPLGDYRYASVSYPEGNKEELQYDARGNVLERRLKAKAASLPDIVTTSSYPATCANPITCNKPMSITDPKGQVTDYSYDSTHGGILTETGPADASGVRPQKRFEYAQRYAWTKNSAGGYSPAGTPVWVLAKEEYCKSTSASGGGCGGGVADEVVTEYDYGPNSGPNNLSVRGVIVTADGQTLRTCYGYDKYGRRISETKPSANLGSCP